MGTFFLVVLTIALIISVVKMKAGEDWARTATPVLAVLIVVFGPVRLLACRGGGPRDVATDMAAATSFQQVCAREFAAAAGKYMAKGSKAIIFSLAEGPEFYDSLVAGLKEGLEANGAKMGPMLAPIQTPNNDAAALNQLFEERLAEHADAGGCLIYGNPIADMEDIKVPEGSKVQIAIMAQRLKPKDAIKRIKTEGIAVVMLAKPDIKWSDVVQISNPEKRFRATYLVITKDNVAEIEKEFK